MMAVNNRNGVAATRTASHTGLVLASASPSRRALLEAAGITFDVDPANIDEMSVRQTLSTGSTEVEPADMALLLASAKAEIVSAAHPGKIVIGADQILALDNRIFEKPEDMNKAAEHLLTLRGKTHQLHAATALATGGNVIWSTVETVHMTMRDLTPAYIGRYLSAAGTEVLQSVGAYKIESHGIHLFEKIEGDYFAILGLPMLPLLKELRDRRLID